MRKNLIYFIIFLLSTVYFLPSVSFAQVDLSSLNGLFQNINVVNYADEMTIELSPENPKPRENVSVRLLMYTENLDISTISWFLDGKLVQKGKGLVTYEFKAPASGKSATLKVSVLLQNGKTFEKSVSLKPLEMDLVWEANSYTPPFYKGKALLPPQGQVKVLAIVDSNNLVFKWTVNGNVRQDLGGLNKKSAVITAPLLGTDIEVEVLAMDPITSKVASKEIIIRAVDPKIYFYEVSPLYGILFNKPLSEIGILQEEINILAVPLNIGMEAFSSLKYRWMVNGASAEESSSRSAIFRKPEGVKGSSRVSLQIESELKPLQSTDSAFSIKY